MNATYIRALNRNAAELQKALLIRTTLIGIEQIEYVATTFTRIVYDALFNDYLSHAIKVFEENNQCASFWYLYRSNARPINNCAKRKRFPLSKLEDVSGKLKIIRNGTHFHIDKRSVVDPQEVWNGAGLTGKELAAALDFAWEALKTIQIDEGIQPPSLQNYSIRDAMRAIERVENVGDHDSELAQIFGESSRRSRSMD